MRSIELLPDVVVMLGGDLRAPNADAPEGGQHQV
jgi:hypothetical protein